MWKQEINQEKNHLRELERPYPDSFSCQRYSTIKMIQILLCFFLLWLHFLHKTCFHGFTASCNLDENISERAGKKNNNTQTAKVNHTLPENTQVNSPRTELHSNRSFIPSRWTREKERKKEVKRGFWVM